MPNFSFITNRLATGGILDTEGQAALLSAGVTHVIDCCETPDSWLSAHPDIHYCHNPTADDGQTKSAQWFGLSIEFALVLALANRYNKVYCHCAAGINRGPSTAYAILRALGFSSDETFARIVSKRPICIGGVGYRNDADAAVKELGYD